MLRWALTRLFWMVLVPVLTLAPAGANATLPDFAQVRASWRASEAQLLDHNGKLVQEIRIDPKLRRTAWTPLAEISPAMIAAVLKAEDQRFFEHTGVDWLAVGKATLTNWLNEKPRGASTLTMQLAGLLDGHYRARVKRRNVSEKWRQMQAAKDLEKYWSKAEILEAYLNLAPFRGELTGIDAATRGLFDKHPAGLNNSEATILAVLIRSPNAKPVDVARRACAFAGKADCKAVKRHTLNVLSGRYPILPLADLAPHLARRLLPQTKQAQAKQVQTQTQAAGGSIQIRSTLDIQLQRQVREVLSQQLKYLDGRNVHDAAALVVDNVSGAVLAYVSLSQRNSAGAENDGVQARRQAGSTLKPFLFGLALEKRLLTAASPLSDEPLSLSTSSGQYSPENYDHTYRGLVSSRVALASSLNIPAVQTLKLVGLEMFAARLSDFGFKGVGRDGEAADFYGYSLALGSLDVQLEELVNAYRSLANGGQLTPLRYTADAPVKRGKRALSPQASFIIGDILSDRQARALTFGLENPLSTRYWSAVKTGTSKDMRDNWCIGYSRRYSVGVWVGNFDGSPMHDVSGISGAAPAWAAIMDTLHPTGGEANPALQAPKPAAGLSHQTIQVGNEPPRKEWFIPGTEPDGNVWQAAEANSAILYPNDGMILALDPDIPAERQQMHLRARNLPPGAIWQIDGVDLSDDIWPLTRGRHRLMLRDAAGMEIDQASFEVR